MKHHALVLRLACALWFMAGPLFGQGNVKITGFTKSGSSITLTLQNTVSVPATAFSTAVRLEVSPDLGVTPWTTTVPHPPFVQSPPGIWSTTFTAPGGGKQFFRAVGILGTAADPDGDGLSDTFEGTLGTLTSLFDSDFDGFSDGQEFAYGTDPLNAAGKPVFLSKPTVNFVLANSVATEGTSPHQVQIVFDRNYSGTVNYSINPLSNRTTTVGVDYAPVTGSLTMNSNAAFIPITLLDDQVVKGQRVILIDLELNGENYFIGGRGSHAVILSDNDAWWTGTLIPASGDVNGRIFRLKVAHEGATTTAVFGAGAGQDGLPIPVVAAGGGAPAIGTTSISEGLIPPGQWAGTVNAATATHFSVDSPVLTVPAGSLFGTEQIGRRLLLNADAALDGPGQAHSLLSNRIIGAYTEALTSAAGAALATLPGTFLLVRDIPTPLPVLTQLVP